MFDGLASLPLGLDKPLIRSTIHPSHPFIHSLTQPLIRLCVHWFVSTFSDSLIHTLMHVIICSCSLKGMLSVGCSQF